MPDSYSDPTLDEQLRDVRVPDGLLGRLRRPDFWEALSWTDQQLDVELADVVVPDSLLIGLARIPEDVDLDTRVRDVEVPWSLKISLSRRERLSHRPRVARLARAALIFLAIGAFYHLSVALLLSGLRPERSEQVYLDVEYNGPLDIEAAPEISLQLAREPDDLLPVNSAAPLRPNIEVDPPLSVPLIVMGPAGQLIHELERGLALEADVFFVRYGSFGYPQGADVELPRFEEPPPPPRGGIEPPLVRSFNRRFLLKYGVNPPVFPGLDPQLCTSVAPLTTSTRSFDLSRRRLADNRLPVESEVLVEDYIAAATFAHSHPEVGELAIEVDGAPSIFGESRGRRVLKDLGWRPGPAQLLQISAVAGRAPRSDRPIQLTIALDISSSMRWDGRLETAKAAIQHVARQLGSKDRISVLAFNDLAERRIEGVDTNGQSQLGEFLASLRADGGTNLPLALQQSLAIALNATVDMDAQPVLVLMTDGRAPLEDETLRQLSQMFEVAVEQGLRFFILEMNEDFDSDPALAELRSALNGDKMTAVDSQFVQRALLEAFGGSETLLASDANLTVKFDPNRVFAYRLMGHEASSGAGLIPAAVETNLHAGEVATCLYELWLKPGVNGPVGEVHLHWRDAQTGRTMQKRREIQTKDFGASFLSAPLSLQNAAIAAEAAEVLRGSPFAASRGKSLAHISKVVERMSSQLSSHREFEDLVRFVEQVERVRQERLSPGN